MATKLARMTTTVPPSPAQPRADGSNIPYGIYGGAGDLPQITEYSDFQISYDPVAAVTLRAGVDLIPGGIIATEGWYGINLVLTARPPTLVAGQYAGNTTQIQVRTGTVTSLDFSDGFIADGDPLCVVEIAATWSKAPELFPNRDDYLLTRSATATHYFAKGTRLGVYHTGGGAQKFLGGDTGDINNYLSNYATPYEWSVEYFLMAAATAELFSGGD